MIDGNRQFEGFVPVSVATLVPKENLGVGLYIRDPHSAAMRLYCAPGVEFTCHDLQRLLDRGHSQVFVKNEEKRVFQQHLRDALAAAITDESLPIERRFALLDEVVRDVLATLHGSGELKVGQTVTECRDLASYTVQLICRDDVAAEALLRLMKHDYRIFTHSANVAYCCLMLARAWGITDPDDLNRIAVGALLHDVGKIGIHKQVLSRCDQLDDVAAEVMRSHPTRGFAKLCPRKDLDFGQLMMVYQHHERLDGQGYPVGLVAEDLHPWAKICGVINAFESLTSNRAGRSASPRAVAIQIMERDAGTAFDAEILKCWKQTINVN